MLRHVVAPSRAFTQIANSHVWDESLSDSAFRLLVRALALPPVRARATTVTELASGLSGGRITTDRARRQLAAAGLLHCARRRSATGQVRTESLPAAGRGTSAARRRRPCRGGRYRGATGLAGTAGSARGGVSRARAPVRRGRAGGWPMPLRMAEPTR
ncbi:hypothetical protein GCM10018781_74390 [Kitasatospora indigofera]|uniref:Uncharacterized protein n=1 Tax=Kitasatospora indigofera TaxID=67307 RepID=A0A919D764_9ACTN|nr:hypothetical protein GCM10018781_74390 [Kitasatospora indigofera]